MNAWMNEMKRKKSLSWWWIKMMNVVIYDFLWYTTVPTLPPTNQNEKDVHWKEFTLYQICNITCLLKYNSFRKHFYHHTLTLKTFLRLRHFTSLLVPLHFLLFFLSYSIILTRALVFLQYNSYSSSWWKRYITIYYT